MAGSLLETSDRSTLVRNMKPGLFNGLSIEPARLTPAKSGKLQGLEDALLARLEDERLPGF